MNGRIVGTKPLYVAIAQRKEERKSHLASQYMQRINTSRLPSAQINPVYSNAAGGPAAMYLPNIQNSATARFYQQPFSTQVRPTPRWPNQARNQVPANTYQNYQMVNTGQPRARLPYNQTNLNAVARGAANTGLRMNFNPAQMRPQPISVATNQQMQQQQMQQQQKPQPKFNNARMQQQMMNPGQAVNPQAINVPGQEPLTTGMLAAAQPQEQKQMLGERLYPLIYTMHPEWAGKITGMLLEIDNAELLHMLDSRESLKAKVDEAVTVLQAHQAKQVQRQAE
jgi:polyadenylate-binding protein